MGIEPTSPGAYVWRRAEVSNPTPLRVPTVFKTVRVTLHVNSPWRKNIETRNTRDSVCAWTFRSAKDIISLGSQLLVTSSLVPASTPSRVLLAYFQLLHVRCRPFHPALPARLCCRRSPYGGWSLSTTFALAVAKFLGYALHVDAMSSLISKFFQFPIVSESSSFILLAYPQRLELCSPWLTARHLHPVELGHTFIFCGADCQTRTDPFGFSDQHFHPVSLDGIIWLLSRDSNPE